MARPIHCPGRYQGHIHIGGDHQRRYSTDDLACDDDALYGFSFPYSRKYVLPHKLRPEALATTQVSLAAVTLLPFFLVDGIARYQFRIGPVAAMLSLGILGTGYAYIWNFQILAAAGSAIASSVTYVTPVVAVIVGVLFLSEPVTWNEPVGGVIVLLGAATSQGRFSRY